MRRPPSSLNGTASPQDTKGGHEIKSPSGPGEVGSCIIVAMDYALQVEPPPYDPPKARQLLAEAGYPTGFDAGELVPMPRFLALGEAIVNQLKAVGIQVTETTSERYGRNTCSVFSFIRASRHPNGHSN
jgi:ABC-type transport system substrate-binding protein